MGNHFYKKEMKTLIITNSYDATTDVLIKYIGCQNIFRLNFDKYEDTIITITSEGIKLKVNKSEITDKDISKVLWRKPFNIDLEIDKYIIAELKYIYREIFNYFSIQNKTILVIPKIENYIGKIVQMTIAKKFFVVPNWSVELNSKLSNGVCVAKSLSSEVTNNNKIIYTTKINKEDLNLKYPWFLQNLIKAELDITIVYIDGKLFAYELVRKKDLIDWRKVINKEKQEWRIHEITTEFKNRITAYMNYISIKFGRLDFLFNSGIYYFLEVNPNGQWAWLDLENKNGLMTEMVRQISPLTNILAKIKTCP